MPNVKLRSELKFSWKISESSMPKQKKLSYEFTSQRRTLWGSRTTCRCICIFYVVLFILMLYAIFLSSIDSWLQLTTTIIRIWSFFLFLLLFLCFNWILLEQRIPHTKLDRTFTESLPVAKGESKSEKISNKTQFRSFMQAKERLKGCFCHHWLKERNRTETKVLTLNASEGDSHIFGGIFIIIN